MRYNSNSPEKHEKRERHNVELKLFTPDEFAIIGLDNRKKYKSSSRLVNREEFFNKKEQITETRTSKPSFKLTLSKNFEFKEEKSEKETIPIFKNPQLKSYVKEK